METLFRMLVIFWKKSYTLETSGEDVKTTLEPSEEDVKTTLETSGEDQDVREVNKCDLSLIFDGFLKLLEQAQGKSITLLKVSVDKLNKRTTTLVDRMVALVGPNF